MSPSRLPKAQNTFTGCRPSPIAAKASPAPLITASTAITTSAKRAPCSQCMRAVAQAIAFGQPQGPALNARRQIAAGAAGQTIGFQVFQGAGVFFAQADGFCQPEVIAVPVTRHPVAIEL